ncbi:GNAT family N-acetyltransferase [Actinacidiphila acididurans]|uniref:GNAT family N-acetyltransferase n=1 Tax=Actinacidiphila acididurans TaxID=2784346 RepID=A0ABS2U3G4_9ACTN|nr:GNAT family N-acetyltransferase [Actinacidiphila acididurans]MBM9510137.1 GNAT family N-acetyltransferase [Actinacidiphila acididurans]
MPGVITEATLRPYRPEDQDAVDDICVRTALDGGDSREVYPDLRLMPSLFAAPYVRFEPDLAFVVDDGRRAVGYIVGTADTAAFAEWFRSEWLPGLVARYPAPTGPATTPTEAMVELMHRPERMVLPELAAYPAHLHIDLLPSHQRAGWGRRLMAAFLARLHEKGVPAVHLGMVTANTSARAFYDRVGFHEIPVPAPGPLTYLGRATSS